MFSVTFDNISSASLNIIGASKIIGTPTPKISTVAVPSSDVTLDFTEAFGDVHYNNRKIALTFLSLQPWNDQMAQDSTVKNALHGRKMNIVFSDDPDYYWTGRISVGDWTYYKGAGRVVLTIDAEPYKRFKTETLEYIQPGGNKNLYPYYDSFETITNDTIASATSMTGNIQAEITSSGAYKGSKALFLVSQDENTPGAVVLGASIADTNYGRPILPPGNYVASCYAKTQASGVSANVMVSVYGYNTRTSNATSNRLYRNSASADLTSTYQRISIPFSITDRYPYAAIRIQVNTPRIPVIFDAFQIEKVDSLEDEPTAWVAATSNSGTSTVTLSNSHRKQVVPYISSSGSVVLSWTGYSVALGEGVNQVIPQLTLNNGDSVTITATGAALLSFRYTEGSL